MNKMAASPKDKFDAAIKVIHSLPKDGPFQPSKDMMLLFYGYFKQATEGPCKMTKPSFWEVIKKAKWDAWQKLGDMDRETAMVNYVEELKKTLKMCAEKWNEMESNGDPRIVEAMPQTNVVGDFMDKLGSFYEIVDEDSPIPNSRVPRRPPGGSAGVTPDFSNSDTSGEPEHDLLDMSARVESALQTFSHIEEDIQSALTTFSTLDDDVIPDNQSHDLALTNGDRVADGEGSFESRSLGSSDSEEEFCDTSDNPILEIEDTQTVTRVSVQSSTPLKISGNPHHVHFADSATNKLPNGRVSPIKDKAEYIHMPAGFPYLTAKVNGEMSDSLLVQTSDTSINRTVNSDVSYSEFSDGNVSANNSILNEELANSCRDVEGGEENEPPGEGRPRQGQSQGQQPAQSSSSGSRRAGSTRSSLSSTSGGRRNLLEGGAGGGSGGQNPGGSGSHDSVNEQITVILARLQQDMTSVLDRLNRLEVQNGQPQREKEARRSSFFSWWPLNGRTGRTAFFILVWPVIVHVLLTYLYRRRRRR